MVPFIVIAVVLIAARALAAPQESLPEQRQPLPENTPNGNGNEGAGDGPTIEDVGATIGTVLGAGAALLPALLPTAAATGGATGAAATATAAPAAAKAVATTAASAALSAGAIVAIVYIIVIIVAIVTTVVVAHIVFGNQAYLDRFFRPTRLEVRYRAANENLFGIGRQQEATFTSDGNPRTIDIGVRDESNAWIVKLREANPDVTFTLIRDGSPDEFAYAIKRIHEESRVPIIQWQKVKALVS